MAEMMLTDAGQPGQLQNWAASCPSTACLAEEREHDGCKVGFDCGRLNSRGPQEEQETIIGRRKIAAEEFPKLLGRGVREELNSKLHQGCLWNPEAQRRHRRA